MILGKNQNVIVSGCILLNNKKNAFKYWFYALFTHSFNDKQYQKGNRYCFRRGCILLPYRLITSQVTNNITSSYGDVRTHINSSRVLSIFRTQSQFQTGYYPKCKTNVRRGLCHSHISASTYSLPIVELIYNKSLYIYIYMIVFNITV